MSTKTATVRGAMHATCGDCDLICP